MFSASEIKHKLMVMGLPTHGDMAAHLARLAQHDVYVAVGGDKKPAWVNIDPQGHQVTVPAEEATLAERLKKLVKPRKQRRRR